MLNFAVFFKKRLRLEAFCFNLASPLNVEWKKRNKDTHKESSGTERMQDVVLSRTIVETVLDNTASSHQNKLIVVAFVLLQSHP